MHLIVGSERACCCCFACSDAPGAFERGDPQRAREHRRQIDRTEIVISSQVGLEIAISVSSIQAGVFTPLIVGRVSTFVSVCA